ncbi:hypothetical protein LZC95_12465 [Pendulispora brunnea]|uniref:LamG domain-containing protein n=1 Tax=Pendulispora brunnea TaxID=2905690 RepID=A0ABZ2KKZ0_9BACT
MVRSLPWGAGIATLILLSCSSKDDSTGTVTSDAGADTGSIIPSAEWSPHQLRPAFWLGEIIEESGGFVTKWVDSTANHNDAVPAGSNSEMMVQSVLIAGHKALRLGYGFDNFSSVLIKDSPSLHWGTDDFVIFIEFRYDLVPILDGGSIDIVTIAQKTKKNDGPGYSGWWISTAPPSYTLGVDLSKEFRLETKGDYPENVMHSAVMIRRGADLLFRVDGTVVSKTKVNPVDVSAPGIDVSVGGHASDQRWFRGDIAALLGVHGTVTDEDISKTENYFRSIYGP